MRQAAAPDGRPQAPSFDKRNELAQDHRPLHAAPTSRCATRAQIFSLLKLGLAVAAKPIQEVQFGDGRSRTRATAEFLVASAGRAARHASTSSSTPSRWREPRVELEANAAGEGVRRKTPQEEAQQELGRRPACEIAQSEGENQAIAAVRKVDFPFYFPKLRVTGGALRRHQSRAPTRSRTSSGKRHDAYRIVVSLGRGRASTTASRAWTWKRPPILDGPHDTRTVNGRKLSCYYDGRGCAWSPGGQARRLLRAQHAGAHD